MNRPEDYVRDFTEGLLRAHAASLRAVDGDPTVIARAAADTHRDTVSIVTGGGSGHLPTFVGFVGDSLADACAVGNVFASPSSAQVARAVRSTAGDRGALLLYGNYGGDRLNFGAAASELATEGIPTAQVRVADDVASAPSSHPQDRRGIAGLFFAYKVLGAAAAEGVDLDRLVQLAARVQHGLRSIGVALRPCQLPTASEPNFDLAPGEMEVGMGIHGEPGVAREPVRAAAELAGQLVDRLFGDLGAAAGDRVAVLVNGLGATPLEELYLVYGHVHDELRRRSVEVGATYVGEYTTALQMAGASISVLVLDDELERYLQARAWSPVLGSL